MDGVAIPTVNLLIEIARIFGLPGLIVLIWYFDMRNLRRILDKYEADVHEARQMYNNNVILVKSYQSLAQDLKDVVVMNTQAITQLCKDVEANQFCPIVRREQSAP
jgi:hypothetical protein